MRIDACMFNDNVFVMGVGVGISFWCVLTWWMKSELCWNFWGPPNLSSSCKNNSSYVKQVSFKNVIFGRYKMIGKPLRIHAKSLSDALHPPKTNCLRRWPPAALQGFRIYSRSAHCLPDFCQKGCRGVKWKHCNIQAPKVARFFMGSKDAPQKMQFLGAIKKVSSLGAFKLYKTRKWR